MPPDPGAPSGGSPVGFSSDGGFPGKSPDGFSPDGGSPGKSPEGFSPDGGSPGKSPEGLSPEGLSGLPFEEDSVAIVMAVPSEAVPALYLFPPM